MHRLRLTAFRRKLFVLHLGLLSWVVPLLAHAERVHFEDAYQSLGHGGDPASFYQSEGLTISGSYLGIIEGISNGNSDLFWLQGTNGPASLGINDYGQSITLTFNGTQNYVCFDLGAYLDPQLESAGYEHTRVQVTANNGGSAVHTEEVTFNGFQHSTGGIWRTRSYADVDQVELEVLGNAMPDWPAWAIDNIRFGEECGAFIPPMADYIPIGRGSSFTLIPIDW